MVPENYTKNFVYCKVFYIHAHVYFYCIILLILKLNNCNNWLSIFGFTKSESYDYIFQIVFDLQNQYDNSLNFKVIKIFKEDDSGSENLKGSPSSICPLQLMEELIFATHEK